MAPLKWLRILQSPLFAILFLIWFHDTAHSQKIQYNLSASAVLDKSTALAAKSTVSTTACGAKITIHSIVVYQDTVQLNLTGPDRLWFGIGFNSSGMGPTTYAIVCDITTCHENYITGHGYGTALTSTVQMIHNKSIHGSRTVILDRKRAITASDTPDFAKYFKFPMNSTTIPVIYAIGQNNAWSPSSPMSFNASTFGATTIAFKTDNDTTNDTLCKPGVTYYGTQGNVGNGLTVGLYIYCKAQTIRLSVEYSDYSPNWFGIVFNTVMAPSPNATVFTTGEKTKPQRPLALYAYDLGAHVLSQVVYREERDWTQIKQTVIGRKVSLIYEQKLHNTKWNIFTKEISFRYAWGSAQQGTVLQPHGPTSTSKVWTFNFKTGSISASGSNMIQMVHGIIMIVSWSVLTTIGIFSSRYRWILCKKAEHKAMWFFVHRGIQSCVVILVLTGFSIAVYFTCKDDETHFSNKHEYFGLTVVILAVLQPINAWFRPHPPATSESKSCGRLSWEILHKSCGYVAWALAQFVIYLGIGRLTSDTLYRTVFVVWVSGVVVVFLLLGVYNACCFTPSPAQLPIFHESDKVLLSPLSDELDR